MIRSGRGRHWRRDRKTKRRDMRRQSMSALEFNFNHYFPDLHSNSIMTRGVKPISLRLIHVGSHKKRMFLFKEMMSDSQTTPALFSNKHDVNPAVEKTTQTAHADSEDTRCELHFDKCVCACVCSEVFSQRARDRLRAKCSFLVGFECVYV